MILFIATEGKMEQSLGLGFDAKLVADCGLS